MVERTLGKGEVLSSILSGGTAFRKIAAPGGGLPVPIRARPERGGDFDHGATVNEVLDVKGLSCPLPVLKAKKRLKAMKSGDTLVVRATDPGSVKDFEAFAGLTGHDLLSSTEDGGVFTFELRRA